MSSDRSDAVPAETAPVPPFLGSAVITEADIDIAEVFHYLDRNALFAGQWMLRKTKEQSQGRLRGNAGGEGRAGVEGVDAALHG